MDVGQQLERVWSRWTTFVIAEPLLAVVAATVAVALMALGVWLLRRRRRVIILPEAATGLVRQPKYLDVAVLSDIHAHVEATDHGRSLRNILEEQAVTDEARAVALRTEQVRTLNKTLDASRRRADLATVLDDQVEDLPEAGTVIEARGTLRVLPATGAAALLVQARTMLAPGWSPSPVGSDERSATEGSLLTRATTHTGPADQPPVVAGIDTLHGRLVTVLDPGSMLDGVRDGEVVSVLAVVGQAISRRDPAHVQDYLPEHLPTDLRESLDGRDVLDVASSLGKALGRDLDVKATVERGPGAMVRAAAIW